MKGLFNASGKLIRFMLRRERVSSTLWLAILVLFSVALVPGLNGIIGTQGEKEALVNTLQNPSMFAMMGPLYADTTGGLYGFLMLLWVMIAVGFMNIFLVVRHARADEERGRAEVIRSLPAGRLSILNATMMTAIIVNSLLALFTGLGMAVMGVEGIGLGGCMLYGVLLGVFGLFCAAVTAIFCQLCVSSRSAIGLSGITVIFFYMLRAIGDMPSETGAIPNEALSYFSPMGLLQRSQVFVENNWWPVFAVLVITVVLTAVAYALNRIRDLDQGFIPARPGRREAKKSLLSPFGLSWRLLRNPIIAWSAGMFIMGASYGSIMADIGTFIESNEFYGDLMIEAPGRLQAESFASTINIMLCICSVIPVLVTVFKLRGEEKDGRLEHVIARAVSRTRYFAGYVTLGFAVSVIVPFLTALGLYASSASVMSDPIGFGFFLKNAMVYLPALWVMLGLAVLLVGLFPKGTVLCWGMMAYSIFVLFFGRILSMPIWIEKTTPFGYIPLLIIENVNWLTLAGLTMVAVVLVTSGFIFYRKRDMLTV